MEMEALKNNLKKQIIEELKLEEITPEDIQNDAPLFGGHGLGLDSIDALELVLILETKYDVKIPDYTVGEKALYSIDTMAEYIVNYVPQ